MPQNSDKSTGGWGSSSKDDGGWGESTTNNDDWGSSNKKDDGWGSSSKTDDGWGSSSKTDDGWGTSSKNDNNRGSFNRNDNNRGNFNRNDNNRGSFNRNDNNRGNFNRNDNNRGNFNRNNNNRGNFNRNDNNLGSSSKNDDGWGSSSKNEDGWGSSGTKDGCASSDKKDSGWGSSNKNGDGWGSSDKKDDGWGSSNKNDDGWGSSDKKDSGWGNSNKKDDGWGNSNKKDDGWGDSNKKDDGWGNSNKKDDGWGNSNKNDDGWGNSSKDNGCVKSEGDWGKQNNSFKRPNDDDNFSPNKKRYKEEDNSERPAPYKPEDLNIDEEVELQNNEVGENFDKYKDHKVTCVPKDLIKPVETFEDVITSKLLLGNIKSQKYTGMTPIQKWAIPSIMDGYDMIGCAQTGSGKTAAFLLPILQKLLNTELEPVDTNSDCQNPYCLIISPTRELANQINVHANMLSRDSIIKCHVIYGQIATHHLKAKLSTGCHILVATPGRLKDFVNRGWIGFKNIKFIILDEGDRLVDEGFSTEIDNFFNHPTMPAIEFRQTLFFSATFKQETQLHATKYLKKEFVFLTVGRIGAANENIKQEFLQVSRQDKKRELKKILSEVPENEKTIIFTQTKNAADMLAGFFNVLKLSSTSIHGDRHQSQREQAIKAFKKGEKRFLISSPVGNRGLDLPKVSLVINYDLPSNIDEYVHRIGRTGRAGHIGRAISFYDGTRDYEIQADLITILTEAKQEIPSWMTQSEPTMDNQLTVAADTFGESEPTSTNASEQPAFVEEEW